MWGKKNSNHEPQNLLQSTRGDILEKFEGAELLS